jgi:hypothetical protein
VLGKSANLPKQASVHFAEPQKQQSVIFFVVNECGCCSNVFIGGRARVDLFSRFT